MRFESIWDYVELVPVLQNKMSTNQLASALNPNDLGSSWANIILASRMRNLRNQAQQTLTVTQFLINRVEQSIFRYGVVPGFATSSGYIFYNPARNYPIRLKLIVSTDELVLDLSP